MAANLASFNKYRLIIQQQVSDWHLIRRRNLFLVVSVVAVLGLLNFGQQLVQTPKPTILLTTPKADAPLVGDKLFVSGKVDPSSAKVLVNGAAASSNGDGEFTIVVPIPEGQSVLKITAQNMFQKAELLQLINRQLTDAEILAKDQQKKLAEMENRQKVLGADQQIEELLTAYNNADGSNYIKVLNHQLAVDQGFKKVTGEVSNNGKEKAYWIKITASFYDEHDALVESKIGFAVALDKALNPGETVKFETQTTNKEFAYYKLSLDWRTNPSLTSTEDPNSITPKEASVAGKFKAPESTKSATKK